MPLPIPHEVGRGGLGERQGGDAAGLVPVGHAAVVLAPGRLLGVAEQVGARDVVVVPGLGAAEAGEVFLRHVRAGAGLAVGLAVIDAAHLEMGVERVPAGAPSAFTIVPGAMRERIHDRAADSEANTAGTEWPLRSRTMMTERRLPF